MRIAFLVLLCISACIACDNRSQKDEVVVDFKAPDSTIGQSHPTRRARTLRVAVSSMISPRETFSSYQDLMVYLSRGMGLPPEFKQRRTYQETNRLLAQREVDVAFICSGAYVASKAANESELLVVPVAHGRPFYRAYVITHNKSGLDSFSDFRGRSFAFTDPMSHTGYTYALMRLREQGSTAKEYFSDSFFTYAHDNSIMLVEKRVVDGASVDGLIYDYYARFEPRRVRNIRVLERSAEFGIPPVVVPVSTPEPMKEQLRRILLTMHEDAQGKAILDKLLIDRFVRGRDEDYNSIREVQRRCSK